MLQPADEHPHEPGPDRWWCEQWTFDVAAADGLGTCTGYAVLPSQRRAWYWTAVVRPGEPLLHLVELEAPFSRHVLEVRTGGLWAAHVCEAPFEQWTVANELYALALDDPADALGHGRGHVTPAALDAEWYAASPPEEIDGGYRQAGTVDGVIELKGGPVHFANAAGERTHRWGVLVPASRAAEEPRPAGRWVPFPLDGPEGPEVLDRVLTGKGWWERRRAR
jgi:hypothetical protein